MGNEARCRVRFGEQQSNGKALLETSEILFRGDFRLKIPFSSIKSAQSVNGELRLQTPKGLAVFALGDAAAKWCDKILHPKSRVEKLGVKPGARVSLLGSCDEGFLRELREMDSVVLDGKAAVDAEWIFFAADLQKHLAQVSKIAKSLKGAAAVWIVYPKGRKDITENDVLDAGRKARLKDVKVVGFSATHTALKFVIPVARR
jgi:hypothetical protein